MKAGLMRLEICVASLALIFSLVTLSGAAIVQPDNYCKFGNNYLQFVGFTCIASEERARNAGAEANIQAWEQYGVWDQWSFHIMNSMVNERGLVVGGTTYCSNFTIVNSGCDGNMTEGSYARTTARYWAGIGDFFFGAYGSTLSMPQQLELGDAGKILFASTASSSINFRCQKQYMEAGKQPECEFEGDKRFPTSYSLMVPASQRGSPILDLFRLAGAKTAVLWQVEGTGPADTADGTLDHSTYAGIEIVSRYFPEPTQESFDALVAQIEKENPDVVVAAGYERACPLWGAALRHNDWTPKAMGITHCVGYKSAKEQAQDSVYGVDFVEFDPRMKGGGFIDDYWFPPVTGRNSATIFIEESFRVLKPLSDANSIPYYDEKEFHWYMAVSVASMQVLARTINESQSLDQGVLQARLGLYDHPSFLGRIGFSTWGLQNLRDVILVQADTNYDLQIVYPLGSATASFAFPIPKFDDRVFKSNYLGKTIELVLAGIIGFCIIVSIVLGALVIHFRAHRIVIAASPLFLLAILVGSILIYSTYFAWLLQAATAACYIRYWLLGLGFVMMFGSLFAKTWRVMRIFLQSNIRIFKITNTQLMLFLAVLVGIEAALLAIWSGTSRPKAVVKINDPLRPRLNQIVCQNGKSGWPMLAILFAYKLALVVYGSYMSIKVWKIPMKLFNESRSIAFSMYNMMAFGLLGFGLQVSGSITDPTMFIIRTLCIAISTFCTVLAIFLPKVMSIHTEYTTGSSRGSSFGSVLKSTDNTDGSMGERPHPTVSKAKARSHDFSLGSRPRTSSKSDSKNDSKLEASSPPPKDTHAPMTTATESAYVDKIKSLKKELKKSNKALRALQMTLLTMESPAHGDQNV